MVSHIFWVINLLLLGHQLFSEVVQTVVVCFFFPFTNLEISNNKSVPPDSGEEISTYFAINIENQLFCENSVPYFEVSLLDLPGFF